MDIMVVLRERIKYLNPLTMEKNGIIELSSNEMIAINGGTKDFAYYLGYAIGYAYGEVICFFAGLGGGLNNHHI